MRSYAAIAGSQFSVVTPGNGMKWQIVEPTQGTYDWSQADELVAFARANGQQVRGHRGRGAKILTGSAPSEVVAGLDIGTVQAGLYRFGPRGRTGRRSGGTWTRSSSLGRCRRRSEHDLMLAAGSSVRRKATAR